MKEPSPSGSASSDDTGRGSPTSTSNSSEEQKTRSHESKREILLERLLWMPPWCRWIEGQPPKFSIWMNILFAFGGAFTVANLYYTHPILDVLARDFNVSYYESSTVPTLMQSGYAIGLFFLCPVGDLVKRRPFVLTLITISATLWIGLCITNNFTAFRVISFLCAVTTVTPQIMLPLVGDLAPPRRRATALSIVTAGNLLGILLARILSGVVTQYTAWRNIYWLALGLQYAILLLMWTFMPDYPRTNNGMNYFKALWSMVAMCRKHAVLVQCSFISFAGQAIFTSFWTTLTFLLSETPYRYSTLVIGLFALLGIAAIILSPLYARLFIDRLTPSVSVYIALALELIPTCIGTYTGNFTIAGPIIMALGLDGGVQIAQIANRSAIYAIEPKGRNRVNTVFMVITFFGQITGTAAGNKLYDQHGWRASGSLSVAFIVFAILLNTIRGPYERGWFGWGGGWSITKRNKNSADGVTDEKPSGLARVEGEHPQSDEEKGRVEAGGRSPQSETRPTDEQ